MNTLTRRHRAVTVMFLLTAIFTVIFTAPAQAQSVEPIDQWKFSITPYLWLPNVNGTLKYNIPPSTGGGGSPEVEAGPNDYLQNLEAVMLLSGEVRKERWSVFTDIIYLGFANQKSSVKEINFGGNIVSSSMNLATSTWLRGMNLTFGVGYAVKTGKAAPVDVFGGLRYFDLSAGTDWQLTATVSGPTNTSQTFPASGSISKSSPLLDGIIGVKGRFPLGESRWSVPYYLDIGMGSSKLTYQWLLGIAYSFRWGDVTLAYRDLYFDQADDKFVQNLQFSGLALGATIRF
jgi:hypothetical protein